MEGVGHSVVCCHFGVEWVIGGHPGGRDAFQEDSLLPAVLITLCRDLNDGSRGGETRLEMCGARASLRNILPVVGCVNLKGGRLASDSCLLKMEVCPCLRRMLGQAATSNCKCTIPCSVQSRLKINLGILDMTWNPTAPTAGQET